MNDIEEAKALLAESAALVAAGLRKNGWCQRIGIRGQSCCAYQASSTYVEPALGWKAMITLDDEVRRRIGNLNIMSWNDTPGRTIEQVLAVYDAIASAP